MKNRKTVVLTIVDGVGIAAPGPGNAVTLADTPELDNLWPNYPHGNLYAAGNHLGMLPAQAGDSEIGHTTLGAGKVILQPIPRINNAIQQDLFNSNPVLNGAIASQKVLGKVIHIPTLIKNDSFSVSMMHVYKLLDLIKAKYLTAEVYIHAFIDEENYESTIDVLEDVDSYCKRLGIGKIATISGARYAMDRTNKWSFTKLVYDLFTEPISAFSKEKNFKEHILKSKESNLKPSEIEPRAVMDFENGGRIIESLDTIIIPMVEYRDFRQLLRAFTDDTFIGWKREKKELDIVSFVEVPDIDVPVAFPPERIDEPLGTYLEEQGLKQLRMATVDKFVHVTRYFNGSALHSNHEDWIELPSVIKYKEEYEITYNELLKELESNITEYDFIVINLGIVDTFAHRGDLQKTVEAMEIIDTTLGHISKLVLKNNGTFVLTSDHGNAEVMYDLQTKEIFTEHTTSQVPLLIVNKDFKRTELPIGTLADVAPTVCSLLDLDIPLEMRGNNLLKAYLNQGKTE